jgi:uncharacterized protein YbjT (DUF2867 family)
MDHRAARRVLVTGATGFIGRALVPALVARGFDVRATTRDLGRAAPRPGVTWVRADVLDETSMRDALSGVEAAYYLVHSMSARSADYGPRDRAAAETFAALAAEAGLARVVYLGGVAPRANPSKHLASRLEVGEILRAGRVPTIELRASMVIGRGSASWQVVRDLAMRLPAMVLPTWLRSRTRPVAIEDVVAALVAALDVPIEGSAWFDLPGPDTLSGREILEHVAAIEGRRVPIVSVPVLSARLSAAWLRLVTHADYALARELVHGLVDVLLPRDERFWELAGHTGLASFDEAARRALEGEPRDRTLRGRLGRLEEAIVRRLSPRARA